MMDGGVALVNRLAKQRIDHVIDQNAVHVDNVGFRALIVDQRPSGRVLILERVDRTLSRDDIHARRTWRVQVAVGQRAVDELEQRVGRLAGVDRAREAEHLHGELGRHVERELLFRRVAPAAGRIDVFFDQILIDIVNVVNAW